MMNLPPLIDHGALQQAAGPMISIRIEPLAGEQQRTETGDVLAFEVDGLRLRRSLWASRVGGL
jgi:hypothetical protein